MPNPAIMTVIGNAHLTWKRHVQRSLTPLGITPKQMYVLRQLVDRLFLYPAEIADMLFCDRPTASVVIGNMSRKGWVRRTRDPDNLKRIRVSITSLGREKLEEAEPEFERAVSAQDPLGCLDQKERKQLGELLGRLLEHLQSVSSGGLCASQQKQPVVSASAGQEEG